MKAPQATTVRCKGRLSILGGAEQASKTDATIHPSVCESSPVILELGLECMRGYDEAFIPCGMLW
jgi:hypothetical protein